MDQRSTPLPMFGVRAAAPYLRVQRRGQPRSAGLPVRDDRDPSAEVPPKMIRVQHLIPSSRWRRPLAAVTAFCTLALAAIVPTSAQGDQINGQGLLWRVDGAHEQPSYVLGTMHVSDERIVDLPAPVRDVLENAGSLTLELVMSPEVMAQAAQASLLRDGQRLEDIIGPDLFRELVGVGQQYGLPALVLQQIQPWAAAVAISLPPEELARTLSGAPVMEQVLEAEARAAGIPVHALETVEEQMAVLGALDEPNQIAMVRQAIEANDEIDNVYETMVSFYLDGDIAGLLSWNLDQMTGDDRALTEAFLEVAVYARNRIMADRIPTRLEEGNALIAVGALHLPGDRGVLRLLESQGYTVSRVY